MTDTAADPERLAGHVLIIEDDKTMRLLETTALERRGWVVAEAATGREGIARAASTLPEVIICDRVLPDYDGIDVIAALASDAATASIPIVLVTAMGSEDDIVRGIAAGAHDYVVKPFSSVELEVRCRAALRVSRQHRLLARSERELRLLSDNTAELVVRCGMDGLMRYVSPSAGRMLGWDPNTLVGRPVTELYHPDDVVTLDLDSAQPGGSFAVNRRMLRVDGSSIWVDSRAQMIEGPDGDLELLSASRDITERRTAAAALAESERAYRRIVDLAAEGVCVVDANDKITLANARMGELLGVPATDLIGHSPSEYTDGDALDLTMAGVNRAPGSREPGSSGSGAALSGDSKFVRPDGTLVWTSFNAAPIIDNGGVFQGSIALVSDVTQRHLHEDALARSEALYRALLEHLPDTVAIVFDAEQRAVVAAGGGLTAQGIDGSDLIGRFVGDIVAPEDRQAFEEFFASAIRGKPISTEFRSHLTGADTLLDVVPVAAGGGEPAEILMVSRDIGPLKQRERALLAAEERWRTAFEQAPVGMAEMGPGSRYRRVNPAFCSMLGYSAEHLLGMSPLDFIHPDDAEAARKSIADGAAGLARVSHNERRFFHAQGRIVWIAVSAAPVYDGEGKVDHVLVHYLDITELKRYESELQHLADHDSLTGLLNRRGFQESLGRHLAHVDRYGPDGALLMVDLDGLKAINDTYGHEAGDRAIIAVADVLRGRLRTTDTIARLGGDEFAVILPSVDRNQASQIAEALVDAICRQAPPEKADRAISVSVGLALFDPAGRTANEMLAAADEAMYAAKSAGRGRFFIAESGR